MEQLPLWMQYVIMFVLGALTFGLCMAAWIRYQDWDCTRQARERQRDYDRNSMMRLKEKVYVLEKLHAKEIKRYDYSLEKEIRRCNK
jgi:hypothetical protein